MYVELWKWDSVLNLGKVASWCHVWRFYQSLPTSIIEFVPQTVYDYTLNMNMDVMYVSVQVCCCYHGYEVIICWSIIDFHAYPIIIVILT